MSEKKHIDRLFQEKFKDFEVSPKEHVWKNIEHELKGKKAKKPLFTPLWYRIAGVAALLAVVFLAGNLFFNETPKPKMVDSEKENPTETQLPSENNNLESPGNKNAIAVEENQSGSKLEKNNPSKQKGTPDSYGDKKIRDNRSISNNTRDAIASYGEARPTNNDYKNVVKEEITGEEKIASIPSNNEFENNIPDKKQPRIPNNSGQNQNNPSIVGKNAANNSNSGENQKGLVTVPNEKKKIDYGENNPKANTDQTSSNKKSLVEVATAQNQNLTKNPDPVFEDKIARNELSKWQVNPYAAPIYYDGFGGENNLDPKLAGNESKGEITMAYGINIAYTISDRLKIRSGVGQVSMNYNTQDIAFVSTIQPIALRNVDYNQEAANIQIYSNPNPGSNDIVQGEFARPAPYSTGTLQQQLGFIEVPLELEYTLIDKKFGVSIIGGASTLVLNKNNLVINSKSGTTKIGEASNLNEVSFSTNIGFGFGYELSEHFEINLEPMFKYQINTYNENINEFNPFYLGVYTGLSFKF